MKSDLKRHILSVHRSDVAKGLDVEGSIVVLPPSGTIVVNGRLRRLEDIGEEALGEEGKSPASGHAHGSAAGAQHHTLETGLTGSHLGPSHPRQLSMENTSPISSGKYIPGPTPYGGNHSITDMEKRLGPNPKNVAMPLQTTLLHEIHPYDRRHPRYQKDKVSFSSPGVVAVSQAMPVVAQTTPVVAQATPHVPQPMPIVPQPMPIVPRPMPVVSQRIPSVNYELSSITHTQPSAGFSSIRARPCKSIPILKPSTPPSWERRK